MNTPEHTPGPWTHLGMGDIHGHEANGGGVDIAAVYLREVDEKWLANAHLIAAAPEMLKALHALTNKGRVPPTQKAFWDARYAIAKAEGVSV